MLERYNIRTTDWDSKGPPVNEQAFASLERHWGNPVPEDYIQFLADVANGGYPTNEPLIFLPPPEYSYDSVNCFSGIGFEGSDLLRPYDFFLPFELGFVPIAHDETGNAFCLSLEILPIGSVWFHDHEGWDDISPMSTMRYISYSFATFLQDLVMPLEYDDPRIDTLPFLRKHMDYLGK